MVKSQLIQIIAFPVLFLEIKHPIKAMKVLAIHEMNKVYFARSVARGGGGLVGYQYIGFIE
jgi:hypothetical protein